MWSMDKESTSGCLKYKTLSPVKYTIGPCCNNKVVVCTGAIASRSSYMFLRPANRTRTNGEVILLEISSDS